MERRRVEAGQVAADALHEPRLERAVERPRAPVHVEEVVVDGRVAELEPPPGEIRP